MTDVNDVRIPSLGPCRLASPMKKLLSGEWAPRFVGDDQRVLVEDRLAESTASAHGVPSVGFELAGPRERIYFEPSKVRCGIVTCGGLCPGLNDVIRGLVMLLWHREKPKAA